MLKKKIDALNLCTVDVVNMFAIDFKSLDVYLDDNSSSEGGNMCVCVLTYLTGLLL